MEVRCEKCQARYRVDDSRIGPQGLTMRCGKCQNTFRVMRAPAPAPAAAPAPEPAAPPASNATMMFAAPAAAPKPAPKPAAPPAAAAPAPDESAGRTMMFPSAPAPPPAAPAKPPPGSAQGGSGTIVFSQPRPSPAKPAPAPPTRPALPKAPAGDAQRSTMIFGASPGAPAAAPPPPQPPPAAPAKEPEPPAAAAAPPAAEAPAPIIEPPGEGEEEEPEAAGEEEAEQEERKPGPFDKAPPRGLLIGVAAGLALLLVIGGLLIAYRKLARHPPPPAAVEMLAAAQAEAALDTPASLASAEAKARDSREAAGPRSRFPEGAAALARIDVQWADALDDEAGRLQDKGGDDARVQQLQADSRAKLKAAFEVLSPAARVNPDSPDLQLGLADYYRAQRSPTLMNRYLKALKDDPRAALVQGMALAQEDDGAERALPKLKAALGAEPNSARVHFRLALAYLALRDEAAARAEVKETLRISPRHEGAQALQERLGNPGAGEKK
ncbi:MAG TPA: zinc-ribbon domain-containing protein [Myxococcales bacterium]|nr:zinc-ribbon domain-containing protein [Myxococcales bacterium]